MRRIHFEWTKYKVTDSLGGKNTRATTDFM